MVVLDAGDSLMAPQRMELDERSLKQRRIKAELIASGFVLSHTDAMALGAIDWTLGSDWVQELVADEKLPVLAANLTCDGKAPYPASKVVDRGGRRLGIVGVTMGEVEGCEVSDPVEALAAGLKALGDVDITIALLPARTAPELAKISGANLEFDIAFDARGTHTRATGDKKGASWMYGSGNKGKSLGILTLGFVEGAEDWGPSGQAAAVQVRLDRLEQRLKATQERADAEKDPDRKALFERQVQSYNAQVDREKKVLVEAEKNTGVGNTLTNGDINLARNIENHAATEALVQKAKSEIGVEQDAKSPNTAPHRIVKGPYAGSDTCIPCHRPEFLQWAGTTHARAYQSLYSEKRHGDDDCYSCHVTGAGAAGGPRSPVEVRGFRDVQCEACHGPGRAHVSEPDNAKLNPPRDPGVEICVECHDGERDGGRFKFDEYRQKITHKSSE